jgi:hypothetical protein
LRKDLRIREKSKRKEKVNTLPTQDLESKEEEGKEALRLTWGGVKH